MPKGDAFRIRYKLGRDEDAPVAATRDLAVDLTAIARSNEEYHIRMLRGAYGRLEDLRCLTESPKYSPRQE
jgi:hypothetical protein